MKCAWCGKNVYHTPSGYLACEDLNCSKLFSLKGGGTVDHEESPQRSLVGRESDEGGKLPDRKRTPSQSTVDHEGV